jgi:hypothetical protein
MTILFKAWVLLFLAQGSQAAQSPESLQDNHQRLEHFIEVQRFVHQIPERLAYTKRQPGSIEGFPLDGRLRLLLVFEPHISEAHHEAWYVLKCLSMNPRHQIINCERQTARKIKFRGQWVINRASDIWSDDQLTSVLRFVEFNKPDDVYLPLLSIARQAHYFEVCYGHNKRLASASFYQFDRICFTVRQIRTASGHVHIFPPKARSEYTLIMD